MIGRASKYEQQDEWLTKLTRKEQRSRRSEGNKGKKKHEK